MTFAATVVSLFAAAAATLPASAPVRSENVAARLVASTATVRPGEPFEVALRLSPDAGWHTYWSNPGDAGMATSLTWTLPEGFEAGEIDWPTPERFALAGVASYGYEGEAWLLVTIRPPATIDGTHVRIAAVADWLECKDVCLPGTAELSIRMPVARGKPRGGTAAKMPEEFRRARARIPRSPGWQAAITDATPLRLEIEVPENVAIDPARALFFSETGNLVEASRPQRITRTSAGSVRVELPRAASGRIEGSTVHGVLVSGEDAWRITATVSAPAPSASDPNAFRNSSKEKTTP